MNIVCALALHGVLLQVFSIPSLLDVFAVWNEPGRLAALRGASVGVYSEKRFLIDGWSVHALSAGFPAMGGVAGLRVWHAGVRPYAETRAQLSYGLRMGPSVLVSAGVGMGDGRPEAEVGTVWEAGKRYRIGLQCRLGAAGAGYGGVSLTWGSGAPVELQFAAGKASGQPVAARVQVSYRPVDRFVLVGGYAAGPLFPYCGAGWAAGRWNMGVVGRWHPYLGMSPGIMIGWGRGRK